MSTCYNFIQAHKSELIDKIKEYLSGNLAHQAMQDHVWNIIESGKSLPKDEPYEEGEDVFWAAVWAIQHLADEGHWKDGTVQRDLTQFLKLLQSGEALPEGWIGRRPRRGVKSTLDP